jgi:hypothetical protein
LRARLLGAEELELGLEDFFDGPEGQGMAHFNGQLFDRVEIQVQPRSSFPEGAPSDDFSPPEGQVAKFRQILWPTLGKRHG